MAAVAVALLRSQLDEAYGYIRAVVEGLTDDEYWWEPVAGCWTVRQDAAGRWSADYPEPPHPIPSPFTTIAWRLDHVAECKVMYHDHAYGSGEESWLTLNSAHTARDAIAMLDRGQRLLEADLASLGDEDLDVSVRTNWGEIWPARQIFTTMIHHDLQHGAEIGVLRDLYRELRARDGAVRS